MRLLGEPDHTGMGATFHCRFYVLNPDGGTNDCSRVSSDLAYLVGSLPFYWMETPLGRSPGRTVAAARRSNKTR